MNFLLNLLWFVLGGWLIALGYLLGGAVLCLTVVGIPFGVQCFKLAGLAAWPFGKEIRTDRTAPGAGLLGGLFNVLWLLVAGVWIFLSQIALAVGLAVTIIGIPFALQHLKLAVLALMPFGRVTAASRN
jgi:uncharacterized membrane protein YccF (DUF307 family)